MTYSIIQYPALPRVYEVPAKPRTITMLVIHATAGSKASDLNELTGRADRLVSVHYYITKMGQIYQLVADANVAYHTGKAIWQGKTGRDGSLNDESIGIELENWNNGNDPYPQQQIDALIWLSRVLVRRYNIPAARFVRHMDISPGRKTDPAGLDWPKLQKAVYAADATATTPTTVIGVTEQSATIDAFLRCLERNKAPLSEVEARRIYQLCVDLGIDAAFFAAVWAEEGRFGRSPLQMQSHCPINIRAAAGEWRPTVKFNDSVWLAYESDQIGAMASIIHLKNVHGWSGRFTVQTIIPVHAPASDGNDPDRYIAHVLESMRYIKEH